MTLKPKRKAATVLVGCAAWLTALGWVDRVTGYELGLFAFYTAPVGVVAWNLGYGAGLAAAFIASLIWFLADRLAGNHYSAAFYGYWNTGMHFVSFIINAITFAKIKSGLGQRRALESELSRMRGELQRRETSGTENASDAKNEARNTENSCAEIVEAGFWATPRTDCGRGGTLPLK